MGAAFPPQKAAPLVTFKKTVTLYVLHLGIPIPNCFCQAPHCACAVNIALFYISVNSFVVFLITSYRSGISYKPRHGSKAISPDRTDAALDLPPVLAIPIFIKSQRSGILTLRFHMRRCVRCQAHGDLLRSSRRGGTIWDLRLIFLRTWNILRTPST